MTRREAPAPRRANGPDRPHGDSPPAVRPPPLWRDLFRACPPAQQDELLALAQCQGLLFAHQLPAPTEADRRPFLTQLLAGHTETLEPVCPPAVSCFDRELDAVQCEAVARAVATSDVFLLQGPPGTGKSRVAAEVVAQAAARGERVLLLAPTSAAVDRILELSAERDSVLAVRCLGRDENADELSDAVRPLVYDERARMLHRQALSGARAALDAAARRVAQLKDAETVWARLADLVAERATLDERLRELGARCERVAADVAREAEASTSGTFATALRDAARRRDEALARVDPEITQLRTAAQAGRQELAALVAEAESLRPCVEAKRAGRWWTGNWWKATLRASAVARFDEIETRLQALRAELDANDARRRSLDEDRAKALARYDAARAQLIEGETTRRRAEADAARSAVGEEQGRLDQEWARLTDPLPDDLRPEVPTCAAVSAAQERWRERLRTAGEEQVFARDWAAHLEQAGAALGSRLPELVNVVAATTSSLPADPHFGDRGGNGTPGPRAFDLLVLDEADWLTESEFLSLARRARRWVLLGEPTADAPAPKPRPAPPGRGRHAVALRPAFFARLWQHLHCDPRSLPSNWAHEGDRLCCRLRAVAPEERQWIESESVADRPEVELRILTAPRRPPVLAEVVFPPATPIPEAKQFVYRELQELPVRATGHSLRWEERPGRLTLRLANRPCHHDTVIDLEAGVREVLDDGAAAWHTCCIEFDPAAGWDRPRAEAWVREHLRLRDLGRTVRLDALHRQRPPLDRVVANLLFGEPANGHAVTASAPAVEFVPVPAPRGERYRPRGEPRSAAANFAADLARLRGGAGFELDLADARHRDRLPAELRPGLPARGLVNYLEAQAVVRALAALAREFAPHAAGALRPVVAALALYPAQAELLRRMVRQAPSLAAVPFDLVVGTPDVLRQREADVVVLGLTRSHTHRAVTYGDGPAQLTLALTRARRRLILVGDPGTLLRRSQWDGPLDHLDDAAAGRERELVAGLVRYLLGQGPYPELFHVRPGGSA